MSKTKLIDNRVKIIQIKEMDVELENMKERIKEILANPNGKYNPLVIGFQSTLNDAQKALEFITKLIESETNMNFSVTVNYNTSNHTKDA